MPTRRRMGAWHYVGWIAVGMLFSFAFVSILSIGVFVLPIAALTLFLVGRRTRYGADALGVIAGVGVTLLIVAFINRNNTPCPTTGLSFGSSGGLDPSPRWLLV